ncbi:MULTISPECIES: hypothetical protein [unclassified Streptomyces]|uniref:hypothetical protein n=1 Tax=unclassified Streptomyces TaxID=2593676 RepID=UPI0006AEDD0C|nr:MULTISPECIES: hypothetical protein [unclassified Streptomyces]KOX32444.1 hypothetical protein ADL06_10465 [Streptomyces sp. NRRL F-6491]KOX48437.1 hypothetical protein ADL08_10255 [Streptomyces sp. NRRL F-6492]
MGASWSALLIAVVGVAGTLGAALLTQVRADRTKRMELRAAADQRREERDHAEELLRAERALQGQRESLERRRACYITLNTAARQYLTEMTNHLHALARGEDVTASLEHLEAARVAYRESYAESQMIVPDVVSRPSGAAKTRLNAAYGKLRKYAADPAAHAAELETMEAELHQDVWPYVGAMKKAMRADLGVED